MSSAYAFLNLQMFEGATFIEGRGLSQLTVSAADTLINCGKASRAVQQFLNKLTLQKIQCK